MVADILRGDFSGAWGHAKEAARAALRGILDIAKNVGKLILAALAAVWEIMKAAAKAAWHWLRDDVVGAVLKAIRAKITNAKDSITDAAAAIWKGIKSVASKQWDLIVGVVSDAWGRISTFINKIIKGINWVLDKLHIGGQIPLLPGGSDTRQSTPPNQTTGRPPTRAITNATGDNQGMGGPGDEEDGGIWGGIKGFFGDVKGWMTDLWDKLGVGAMLPQPFGGLFGGVSGFLLEKAKDAIMAVIKRWGGDRMEIVELAKSRVGDPYVWGGQAPGGFDCSGLTYWAYMAAGHPINRIPTYGGRQVTSSTMLPADILFYYPNALQRGERVPFGHFKMYIGDGQTVESASGGVQIRPLDSSFAQVRTYLAAGGLAMGPRSGYPAVMHGNEAVIPLDDPRTARKLRAAGLTGEQYVDQRVFNLYVKTEAGGRVDVKRLWADINAIEGRASRASRRGRVRG
jgi:hypothetical protein